MNKEFNPKNWFKNIFLLLLLGSLTLQGFAQKTIVREGIAYPIPPSEPNRMFYLQRTPNTNTIACDLNIVNGQLDTDKPLTTYWLRYGDSPKGEKKELNFIQRKFAYGLNIKKISDTRYEFWFVSYKKYHMYLLKNKENEWKVYGKINNEVAVMNSIFIYIKGGSFWNPHVVYVEIKGNDIKTGNEEVERLTNVKKEES
ncbi:hypothetical protein A9P82_14950 [Arachidicoccus ginsenosidimutans]|uniref:DUF4833 domain-containing protein n=1 Tax=Arachidicoccus sp. BS20 TaxID=1850526 RepID=UPI0007F084ED|nr:DUF4833 domain-containing protein [Arachidicoccus sp. BS20]ANI90469.1 hypothetical protein A9P82_14950 [Arachidicoccus sp. BS20]